MEKVPEEEERSISSEDAVYYHNQGQQDAAKGEWNSQMPLGSVLGSRADHDRQIAYDQGHDNHTKQKSG